MSGKTKLRRTLALVLAGGSLAIGVPAALAAGGGDTGEGAAAPTPGFVQEDRSERSRPDHDCPERGGGERGNEGGGASGDAATTTPAL